MNRVKSTFSIKDLENISGIKAHTLRIWEKRFNLLSPKRTQTNIRRYSLFSLQKLLNITLLYKHGYKISKIARIDNAELPEVVREITLKSNSEQISINALKLAMINFDNFLFDATFDKILTKNDFTFIYVNVFLPIMNELGILWQTNAISPSHEHFVTNLIKQKIHIQTEKAQKTHIPKDNNRVFVLYLPENEVHELSILFLNYYILEHGFKTIFLGQSLPAESLENILSVNENLVFVTHLTVEPNKNIIDDYLLNFHDLILKNNTTELAILGPQQLNINLKTLPDRINLFDSVLSFQAKYFKNDVFA
jgi:DNA-binding transcriptional MerR regulator